MQNPSEETQLYFAPIDGVCKFLDQDTNKCTLQDTNKPPVCCLFPSFMNPFHPHYLNVKDVCSYRFIETVELEEENA